MAAGRTLGTNRPWPPPGGGHGHGRPRASRQNPLRHHLRHQQQKPAQGTRVTLKLHATGQRPGAPHNGQSSCRVIPARRAMALTGAID